MGRGVQAGLSKHNQAGCGGNLGRAGERSDELALGDTQLKKRKLKQKNVLKPASGKKHWSHWMFTKNKKDLKDPTLGSPYWNQLVYLYKPRFRTTL